MAIAAFKKYNMSQDNLGDEDVYVNSGQVIAFEKNKNTKQSCTTITLANGATVNVTGTPHEVWRTFSDVGA
ncbi:hypothetical protein GFL38_20385 [Rhizobium leguminosarum bv. viciae]|uniref:hypothetical protein n=1 Tax=Rhizobium ruizarguesonis TaxID=2081791 RepID=UPI00143F2BF1|nr:hypothetical protein [Rhizobium ruizarguesonis]NKJ74582.1 hypothetical protein [Rhizobium leguminosarum bv. viciae]NKQ73783.1 hypothetical protein [Rhizobium ruizarguesonis]NKQ79735.1 hypothetical protein [Rhizobium ruizarguesonis]